MSDVFTTDNIDKVRARALGLPGGWEVTFSSTNDGLYHQLYVNGVLADFTDTPCQRSFVVDRECSAQELVIAAVDGENRAVDMSSRLEVQARNPAWIYRASVALGADLPRHGRIAILADHTTGQMDSTPLIERQARPDWCEWWGFGEDPFALGGMGYDAFHAPGAGNGAFGAGAFGVGARLLSLEAPLAEPGAQKVLLRLTSEKGQHGEDEIENVWSSPPSCAPGSLTATDYDVQAETLTVQIQ